MPAASAPEQRPSISALDVIELQIGYTTILARYYKPVAPRVLVDGARTGIAAVLRDHGIDAALPYTPAHVELYDGEDLIDALVFKSLARYGSHVDAHDLIGAALSGELAIRIPSSSIRSSSRSSTRFSVTRRSAASARSSRSRRRAMRTSIA